MFFELKKIIYINNVKNIFLIIITLKSYSQVLIKNFEEIWKRLFKNFYMTFFPLELTFTGIDGQLHCKK